MTIEKNSQFPGLPNVEGTNLILLARMDCKAARVLQLHQTIADATNFPFNGSEIPLPYCRLSRDRGIDIFVYDIDERGERTTILAADSVHPTFPKKPETYQLEVPIDRLYVPGIVYTVFDTGRLPMLIADFKPKESNQQSIITAHLILNRPVDWILDVAERTRFGGGNPGKIINKFTSFYVTAIEIEPPV